MKPKETEVSPREFWFVETPTGWQRFSMNPHWVTADVILHVREVLPDAQETAEVAPEFPYNQYQDKVVEFLSAKGLPKMNDPDVIGEALGSMAKYMAVWAFNRGVEAARNSKRSETKRGGG